MKEKFTGGDWKVLSRETGYAKYAIAWSDDGELVCDVVQEKADADLMAASKGLYDALEQFTEMFTDTKKYPDPETITTGLRIFLPKALEALMRARGEA